jgi:membrane associated rhomboid family serine protease
MGFSLALVTEPVQTGVDRLKRIPLWVVATSLFGVGLAQGSAPLRDIFRISLWAALIGLIIGLVHYIALEAIARRQPGR